MFRKLLHKIHTYRANKAFNALYWYWAFNSDELDDDEMVKVIDTLDILRRKL